MSTLVIQNSIKRHAHSPDGNHSIDNVTNTAKRFYFIQPIAELFWLKIHF